MRLLIAVPLLILLVLFVLSNREPVRLGLWPTDYALQLPLSLTVVGAMAVAFVAGALIVWLTELPRRRRARRMEEQVRLLEAQVEELKARSSLPRLG
jgi:lipopolysaccharide assembly protein A